MNVSRLVHRAERRPLIADSTLARVVVVGGVAGEHAYRGVAGLVPDGEPVSMVEQPAVLVAAAPGMVVNIVSAIVVQKLGRARRRATCPSAAAPARTPWSAASYQCPSANALAGGEHSAAEVAMSMPTTMREPSTRRSAASPRQRWRARQWRR
jgi:hypothetical protein